MAAYFDDPRLYKYYNEGSTEPIFRKISKSRVLALYLPKRELWDHPATRFPKEPLTAEEKYHENPFENCILQGMVGVNIPYVGAVDKVYVEVNAYYKYDKNEVNQFEFNVKRLIYRAYKQLYSMEDLPLKEINMEGYSQTMKLLQIKLGEGYFPFVFDISGASDSAWIHDFKSPNYKNGIYWEVRAYTHSIPELHPSPENLVQMRIRKFTYVSPEYIPFEPDPFSTIDRQYASLLSDGGAINLQSELNKYLYYMGDEIVVSIGVTNASNRVIKKVTVAIKQILKLEFWKYKEYVVTIQDKSITNESLTIPIMPKTEYWKSKITMEATSLTTEDDSVNLVVEVPYLSTCRKPNQVHLAASTLHRDELNVLYNEKHPDIEGVESSTTTPHPIHVRYQVEVTCEVSPSGNGLEGESPHTTNEFIWCHPQPYLKPQMRVQAPKPY